MLTEFKKHLQSYLSEEEIEDLISGIESVRYQGLLLNTNKCSEALLLSYFPSLIKHSLIDNAYIYNPLEIEPGKHFLFNAGAYYLQDLSAMLVGFLLDVEDDDVIVDLCAAPGGKTFQVANKNPNTIVIANDISGLRAKNLAQNIERFGLANVVVTNEDALRLLDKAPYMFDKIILDAPCSGSGMFKKRQDMLDDWSLNKVLKFQAIQKEMIIKAYSKLKNGGKLIYSTCSFSYEEDEAVIEHLLLNSDANVLNLARDKSFSPSQTIEGAIHLFPHQYMGDGHFICLLEKPGIASKKQLPLPKEQTFGRFNLSLSISQKDEYYFGLSRDLKLPFTIVRKGIFLGTSKKGIFDYNHHLSHYLPQSFSLQLNDVEKEKYLCGQTFYQPSFSDGFHVVSYKGINLGFVKVSRGNVKNHYPKALRRPH